MVIRAIFVKDATDYPFEGCQPGLAKGKNMDYKFIVNTLQEHLGDDVYFTEVNGQFQLPYNETDVDIIKKISSDTGNFPVKRGRAQLRFEIMEIITTTTF